jgi:uncharacterized membrane protein
MNTKTILSFIVATIFVALAVSTVMASTSTTLPLTGFSVEANDVSLTNGTTLLAGSPGETVELTVRFQATATMQDLKLKAEALDVSTSSSKFDVFNGSSYARKLTLTLPSVKDMEDNPEGFTLHVTVTSKSEGDYELDYTIKMQKESFALELLSVESPAKASAGEVIAFDVVLKNIGGRETTDAFVTVSIPELGVYKKAYFGDLTENDNASEDKQDARERILYLVVPSDAKSGDYTVEIKASNYETTSTARKVISINGITPSTNSTATPLAPSTGSKLPTSIIVLTVVLVIIFVVLLVVLIVLLTKKPSERIEDFGETSYY